MLEPLGISTTAETTYVEVLRRPGSSENALAAACGLALPELRRALSALAACHLVHHQAAHGPDGGPGWVAEPPDAAVSALVRTRREELERARCALRDLGELYRQSSAEQEPSRLLTTVTGRARVRDRFAAVVDGAAEELMLLNVSLPGTVRRGVPAHVRSRAVYSSSLLDAQGRREGARRLGLPEAQVRVGPAPPVSLVLADRCLGVTAATGPSDGLADVATEVRNPAVLEALLALFEDAWSQADTSAGDGQTARADARTLELLTTGAKDTGIARRLGVSDRTAQRRIAQLIRRFGAATRFQAGVQAARAGASGEPSRGRCDEQQP